MKEFLELLKLIQPDNSTEPDLFVSQIGWAYIYKNPLQLLQKTPAIYPPKELEYQYGKNITEEMRSQLS